MKFIYSFPKAGRYFAVSRTVEINTCNNYLGREIEEVQTGPPSFLFPPAVLTEHDDSVGWLRSAVPAVYPHGSLCNPRLLTGGTVSETENTLTV